MALYRSMTTGKLMEKDLTCELFKDALGECWERVREDGVREHSALSSQVGGSHYKGFAIQPVEFIHKNKLPYIEGCCIKYLCRWREKNGIEDL